MDTIQIPQEEATRHMTGGTLFPGKLRGIQQVANAQGVITVTALDHRGSLKQSLQRARPDRTIGYAEIVAEKLRMVRVFAPHSSAILLDPVFGAAQAVAAQALPGSVGLIVALEESGYRQAARGTGRARRGGVPSARHRLSARADVLPDRA